MTRVVIFFAMLLVLLFVASWPFCTERFAIEKTNRYRVLANGWVSMYADMHMSDKLTWTEKIHQTISADFIHGRFRPAFFFYVTRAYALSPLAHVRSSAAEGRPYRELMNGDLRLFSFIYL